MRDHAGWSINSKMPSVYLHYFGTESCNSLLETFGVVKKQSGQGSFQTSKLCPSCKEPNKQDSKFCASCKMVLTYDAYSETLEKEQKIPDDAVVNILQNWLSKCNDMRTLNFNMQYLIKQNTRNSRKRRYLPISFHNLKSENQGLYSTILSSTR